MNRPDEELRVVKFRKAVEALRVMLERRRREPGDDAVRDSIIHRFETAFELGWKCIRDWLAEHHPEVQVFGAKSTLTTALELGLIADGNAWSEMLADRNLTTHTYNEPMAIRVAGGIEARSLELFDGLLARLD